MKSAMFALLSALLSALFFVGVYGTPIDATVSTQEVVEEVVTSYTLIPLTSKPDGQIGYFAGASPVSPPDTTPPDSSNVQVGYRAGSPSGTLLELISDDHTDGAAPAEAPSAAPQAPSGAASEPSSATSVAPDVAPASSTPESAPFTPPANDGNQCDFPQNSGLVAVTPQYENAGWAMSPNQKCTRGSWCPYACPAGYQSGQWNTSPSRGRMDGGLFCNAQGQLEMPRPDEPLCKDYRGEITVRNVGRYPAHVCQTIFPGTEDMVVPNTCNPNEPVRVAVPDPSAYYAPDQTGGPAGPHFFVNAPGIPKDQACAWGTASSGPQGNWAPYVIGTSRQPGTGRVHATIGWNPVYLENASPYRNQRPSYGLKVSCISGDCSNAVCEIDPRVHDVNEMTGGQQEGAQATSLGPANTYCNFSVQEGGEAEVQIFEV